MLGGAAAAAAATAISGCSSTGRSGRTTSRQRRVPDPVAATVTRWGSDPWSLGAVSFLPPGAHVGLRDALAEPIAGGRLHLAGEATSVGHAGTVRGALLSGRLAGDAVRATFGDRARVVVVGAGMAGVAATRLLSDSGVEVVTIEARAQVGGRIFTERRARFAPVDLGASRIGGGHEDPVVAVLDDLHLARREVGGGEALHSGPRRLSDARAGALEGSFRRLTQGAAHLDRHPAAPRSLAARFDEVDPRWRSDDGLRWAVASRIEHQYGAEVEGLALRQGDDGRRPASGDIQVEHGLDELAVILSQDADVRVGEAAREVIVGPGGVEVVSTKRRYRADAVIVTLPLGVLKAGTVRFSPPLPEGTSRAIATIGNGLIDQVVLRFRHQFWEDEPSLGWLGHPQHRFAAWRNLAPVTGEPVLMGVNAGASARDLQQRPRREVVAEAMQVLRAMYEP